VRHVAPLTGHRTGEMRRNGASRQGFPGSAGHVAHTATNGHVPYMHTEDAAPEGYRHLVRSGAARGARSHPCLRAGKFVAYGRAIWSESCHQPHL
jgi:hypothetical protein